MGDTTIFLGLYASQSASADTCLNRLLMVEEQTGFQGNKRKLVKTRLKNTLHIYYQGTKHLY